MRFLNPHGYRPALVRALMRSRERSAPRVSDRSITELSRGPYELRLLRERDEDIEVNLDDLTDMAVGTWIHAGLERGAGDDELAECSLYVDVKGPLGTWKVGGKFDFLSGSGLLLDWKSAKVASLRYDHAEWECQLNAYAALARAHGFEVTALEVCAYLKDWSATDRARQHPSRFAVVPIPLWSHERAMAWLRERVRLHQECEGAASLADVAPCSPEERWARPEKWAVMRSGKARAEKLHDQLGEALAHGEQLGGKAAGIEVKHRPGSALRCESWCWARKVCPVALGGAA